MSNRDILQAVLDGRQLPTARRLLPGEAEVCMRRGEAYLLSRERVESILSDLDRLEGYDVATGRGGK